MFYLLKLRKEKTFGSALIKLIYLLKKKNKFEKYLRPTGRLKAIDSVITLD